VSYSLYIYIPEPNEPTFTETELTNYLIQLDFASLANSGSLQVGSQLMDFITFLGCSPSLSVGEVDSAIKIHFFDETTGLGGDSIQSLRYPTCKHLLDNPAHLIKNYPQSTDWLCPSCGLTGKIDTINWRKSAGFSFVFIEVSQIFPKEAVPSDKLLKALQTFSHRDWQWFYSKASSVYT